MLEVAAVANKAYRQVLKDFPNFLTRGSVTIALVDTLAKAHEKHTLAVLEGIEQSHENWVQLKVQRSNVEAQLLACNGQLFKCLFMEVAHLSPAAFSNVLNLSVGLLPPIQHTMLPTQPTIVLTTQVPTLGVIPSMGINFSVAGSAGDGGDDGGDGGQQADDSPPEDCGTEPEDPEGGDPGDHDDDVIMVSSPSCRAVRCSVIPLSTSGWDMDAGSSSGGMAINSSRIGGGGRVSSPCLLNPDMLKLTPSMLTAAAQMLIKSTYELLDHPTKSPKSLVTQVQREAAVAKIRPSIWAEGAADMKRIKQKQVPLGQVSNKLVFHIFDPKLVLEDILDLIVLRLSPEVFIDHHTTAIYKPNLDIPCIKHMYLKFKYMYVIWLCHTSADFSMPQLFARVLTPHTVKKHTIPGVIAKT